MAFGRDAYPGMGDCLMCMVARLVHTGLGLIVRLLMKSGMKSGMKRVCWMLCPCISRIWSDGSKNKCGVSGVCVAGVGVSFFFWRQGARMSSDQVSTGTCDVQRGGLQDFPSASTPRRSKKKEKKKSTNAKRQKSVTEEKVVRDVIKG